MSIEGSVKRGRADFMLGAPRVHFEIRKNDEGLFEGYEYGASTPVAGTAKEDEIDCIRATREALWDKMKSGI